MDLVDEQHVAFFELGEDRGEVARPFKRRSGCDVQMHAHLDGDNAGHRGFAETGRPSHQQVVGWLAALLRGLEHNREVFFQLALANKLAEPSRP